MTAAPAFRPTSVKRPHWVLLGPAGGLVGVQRHTVLGAKLLSYRDPAGALRVALDECPHRGASLAMGGRALEDGAFECPGHGRALAPGADCGRFFGHFDTQSLVWVDYSKDVLAQHHPPPRCPEFSAWGYGLTDHAVRTAAHPAAVVESLLDWRHALAALPGDGGCVDAASAGASGHEARSFDGLRASAGYDAPYTAWLRFTPGGDDPRWPGASSVVWLSVTPEARTSLVHVRVAVPLGDGDGADCPAAAAAGRAAALLLGGLASAPAPDWRAPLYGADDGLVRSYRAAVRRCFGDLLAYWRMD